MGGEEPVFCVCRQPDDGSIMIQCNYCDEWYHVGCVGVAAEMLDSLKEYCCPPCQTKKPPNFTMEGRKTVQSRKRTTPPPPPPPYEEGSSTVKRNRRESGESSLAVTLTQPKKKVVKTIHALQPGTLSKSKFVEYHHHQQQGENDSIRRTVVEGLVNVLSPFWNVKSIDTDGAYEKVEELAMAIELEMFKALAEPQPELYGGDGASSISTRCGSNYKAKYRTLQFNLKDPKNEKLRVSLFSGAILPARLVSMSPAEMANEEVAAVVKSVREQSIAQLTIPDGTIETGFVKKTHKGEDYFLLNNLVKVGEEGSSSTDLAAYPAATNNSAPASSLPLLGGGWVGKIYIPEVGRVPAIGSFVSSASRTLNFQTLTRFLPHNMHVSGRIVVSTAADYVKQIWAGSTSRDVAFFQLNIADDKFSVNDGPSVNSIIEYLSQHDRWAVVVSDPTRGVRDFYLAPIVTLTDLTNFPERSLPKDIEKRLPALFAIIVIAKDGRPVPPNNPHDIYDPHQP